MAKTMRRYVAAGATVALGTSALLGLTAVPAVADTRSKSCSTLHGGGTYTADHRVTYFSDPSNSNYWRLSTTSYRYGPNAPGSDQNNQDVDLFSGNDYSFYRSADNLIRDHQWHTGIVFTGPLPRGLKGQTTVGFIATFDKSGTDPQCYAFTSTF